MAYNVAPFSGTRARIEKNDVAIEFTGGWTLNTNVKLISTTKQGAYWDTNIPDVGSWSGSFNGQFVAGNTEQKALIDNIIAATPGTKLTDIKFLLDVSTNAFNGDLYVESMAVTANMGSTVTVVWNFKGDGAPSISASA